jgi:hypothetical protein
LIGQQDVLADVDAAGERTTNLVAAWRRSRP